MNISGYRGPLLAAAFNNLKKWHNKILEALQFCNSVESVQIWAVKPIDLLMILSPYLHGTSCIHHNAHQLEKTWLSYLLTCHTSVISIRASSSTICMIFEIYTLELQHKCIPQGKYFSRAKVAFKLLTSSPSKHFREGTCQKPMLIFNEKNAGTTLYWRTCGINWVWKWECVAERKSLRSQEARLHTDTSLAN